jgi:hypothetical protein
VEPQDLPRRGQGQDAAILYQTLFLQEGKMKKKKYTPPSYIVTAKNFDGNIFTFISRFLSSDKTIIARTGGKIVSIKRKK